MLKNFEYTLAWNGTSEVLTHNPAGWDKVGVNFVLNDFYHTKLRNRTVSLRFPNMVGAGYSFIKNAYDTEGIYMVVTVTIKELNSDTNGYEAFYTGVIDTHPDKLTFDNDLFVEVSLMDSDKLQKFISRDENEVDVTGSKTMDGTSITPLAPVDIYLTPVNITLRTDVVCAIVEERSFSSGDVTQYMYIENPTFTRNEITGITIYNDGGDDIPQQKIYTNSSNSYVNITIVYTSEYLYSGSIVNHVGSGNLLMRTDIISYDKDDVETHVEFIREVAVPLYDGAFDSSGSTSHSYTFPLAPEGSIGIETRCWVITTGSAHIDLALEETLTLNITEVTIGKPMFATKAFYPFEFITQLLRVLTDDVTTSPILISSVFGRQSLGYPSNGDLAYDMVMNGLQIRSYPAPKVFAKLRDYFKSEDALNNLGLSYDHVNGRFVLERKEYFFDSSVKLFDLDSVANFKKKPYPKGYFSKISGGFENTGDYERVQGALEFAVQKEFSTAAKVKDELNIRCPYRLDSVMFEEIKNMQYNEASSIDSNEDKSIFIVRCHPVQYDGSPPFTGISPVLPTVGSPAYTGMDIFSTYYNTMYTPRQNAVRWGNIIKNAHFKNLTKNILSQKMDKQISLAVDGIDENSDITMTELVDPLYDPEVLIVESYLDRAKTQALIANPNGSIGFEFNDNRYEGYVLEINMIEDDQKVNIQLLSKSLSKRNFIFEQNIDANYIFEQNINDNKVFE